MNREKLRSLAIGFLSSAILLGAYATFFQGYVPVKGVNINSVMNTSTNSKEIKQYQDEIASLTKDNESLAKDQTNDPKAKEQQSSQSKKIASLESTNESLTKELNSLRSGSSTKPNQESQDESQIDDETNWDDSDNDYEDDGYDYEDTYDEDYDTADYDDYAEAAEPAVSGEFVIASGDTSTSIAYELESAGYIESAQEFQDLLAYWDLETLLQDGSYQLNSNMSIHEIAELLTNHAYYYIP